MRLTDLLGTDVRAMHGAPLGRVHDVRLVQDGAPLGTWGAALRVHTLVVGPRAIGVRLGFDRAGVEGPWLLKTAFVALHRSMVEVGWDDVIALGSDQIVLDDEWSDRSDDPTRRPAGRVVDAGLELLDRQLVDPDGRLAGKVDDLELTLGDQGPPAATAILAGPGSLDRRLGGRLGRWVAGIHARLQDRHLEGPARIGFGTVVRLDQAVHLNVGRRDLPTDALEAWVRTRVIEKIPGAGVRSSERS